jgi:chromosome partitioning protein
MIVLLGGQKGGTGKSNIAVNLAVYNALKGKSVLLVDGNSKQGTCSNWAERREASELTSVSCIEKQGTLHKTLLDLSDKYDEIIVDTGGQDSKEFRTSLTAADVLVSPMSPSQSDIETIVYLNDLVDEAKEYNPELEAKVVFSKVRPHHVKTKIPDNRELINDNTDLKVMGALVYLREIYVDASPGGHGVLELNDKKAKLEIEALAKEIYG